MKQFIQHGDEQAFSFLYKRHFESLSKYINYLIRDVEHGKDLAQRIFVKIYENPQLFKTTENFKVWLYSIAKNQWRNERRNQAIRARHQDILVKDYQSQEVVENDQNATLKYLESALDKLSEIQREIFVLKYSNSLTIKEIGIICQCSEGTVKSRLFYALKILRKEMQVILNHHN